MHPTLDQYAFISVQKCKRNYYHLSFTVVLQIIAVLEAKVNSDDYLFTAKMRSIFYFSRASPKLGDRRELPKNKD